MKTFGTSGLAGPKARKSVIPPCVGAEKRPRRTPETARTAGRSEGPGAGKRPGFLPAFFSSTGPSPETARNGDKLPGRDRAPPGPGKGHTGPCGGPHGAATVVYIHGLCAGPSECAAQRAPPRSAGGRTAVVLGTPVWYLSHNSPDLPVCPVGPTIAGAFHINTGVPDNYFIRECIAVCSDSALCLPHSQN